MRTGFSKIKYFSLLAVLLSGLVACGVGGNTGRLSLSITDAATDQYNAVYVTIKEIAVHAADDPAESWTTVATPNRTYNLLALVNGVREQLGMADLAAGHYTQMRLIIGDNNDGGINILGRVHPPYANYVIDSSDKYHELRVPSGIQTGVKLVQGFDINENSTTELTLDFDAARSVVIAGKNGKYLLKPTIHVVDTDLASIVSGTVTTKAADQSDIAVEGALVSAQIYVDKPVGDIDEVTVRAATVSAENGAYKLFVAANAQDAAYNLVANKEGFAPLAYRLKAEAGNTYLQDFPLVAATDFGTVDITIAGAGQDTYVTLSFRQKVILDSAEVMIEVMSKNYLNGSYQGDQADPSYQVDLPAGEYTVVASTPGKASLEIAVSVTKDAHTPLAVSFPL